MGIDIDRHTHTHTSTIDYIPSHIKGDKNHGTKKNGKCERT